MKKICIGLLTLMVLNSCTTAKMALNETQWPAKKEYAVTGKDPGFRKQQLTFGAYQTKEIKRSWTKGYTTNIPLLSTWKTPFERTSVVAFEHMKKKQKLHFQLQDSLGNSSAVFCAANVKSKDLILGNSSVSATNIALDMLGIGIESENKFFMQIYTSKHEKPWELWLDNRQAQRSKSYTGTLIQDKDNYYTVVPVNQLMGKNGPVTLFAGSVGFEIRNKEGKPLAAVTPMNKGTVYLAEMPEAERFLMANVCAALLLRPVLD